jgi:hypothetical protein
MNLVEVVVALMLALLISAGLWSAAAAARRQTVVAERWSARVDARRVVGLLLDLDADGFTAAERPGEVAVRAHRWWGLTCAGTPVGPTSAEVVLRGLRRPDPTKDSVRVVLADGRIARRRLLRVVRPTECADPDAIRVEWDAPADGHVLVVHGYERGAYRLDDAFRYRRGAGGAQPLTSALFDPDTVEIRYAGDRVRVVADRGPARSWGWR